MMEQMGGAGGMGGMGGMGGGDMPDFGSGDDEDDDEMPELDENEAGSSQDKGKGKADVSSCQLLLVFANSTCDCVEADLTFRLRKLSRGEIMIIICICGKTLFEPTCPIRHL